MKLVYRPGYGRWGEGGGEVADFTDDDRPAFRVGCHCLNCGWRGEARFRVGTKIALWNECPKCELHELSSHGSFLGRDEQTLEEERQAYKDHLDRLRSAR
jgi:hypothetical protein